MAEELTPLQASKKAALGVLGFHPLSVAQPGKNVNSIFNVIGVVVERDSPRQANGGRREWFTTFSICDYFRPSISDSVKVRIFWPTAEALPDFKLTSTNEVILLRSVKWMKFGSEHMLISNNSGDKFSYVLLRAPVIPGGPTVPAKSMMPQGRRQIFVSEKVYADDLRKWWVGENLSTADFVQSQRSTVSSSSRNRNSKRLGPTLIKDLKYDHFHEVVGEVVKTFNDSNCFSVHITDYTENPNLYNREWGIHRGEYTQEQSWPGPFGRYTIQVDLWDQNADSGMREIREGQYVCFTNMRAKVNKAGLMEGSISGDRMYPDKIDFRIINDTLDSRIPELEKRKDEYNRDFSTQRNKYSSTLEQKIAEQRRGSRHSADDEEEQDDHDASSDSSDSESDDSPSSSTRKLSNSSSSSNHTINPRIRSENPALPLTSLSEIYGLCRNHYINQKYRVLIRVIDFLPRKLHDFAVYAPPPEEPGSDDEIDVNEYTKKPKKVWQWRFAFLVEDQNGTKMQVIVSGKEAEYLLKFEACDLRKDKNDLHKLRQKLSHVWGNLYNIKNPRKKRPTPPINISHNPKKRGHRSKYKPHKRRRTGNGDDVGGRGYDDDNDEHEDEEPNGVFFHACIAEYGVYNDGGHHHDGDEKCKGEEKCDCREHEQTKGWRRKWKLFGTTMH